MRGGDSRSTNLNARRLEDEFFLKEDAKLLARLREMRKLEETKEALAEASGISDPQVLAKLIQLDVQVETLAALSVVPLVEVAWADGRIEERERDAIMQGAQSLEIKLGSIEYDLLDEWLKHQPEPTLLAAWSQYVQGLCAQMSPPEKEAFRTSFMGKARAVAEAAGGFLGIGNKVSPAEEKMLKTLADAFN